MRMPSLRDSVPPVSFMWKVVPIDDDDFMKMSREGSGG
jgi:hypothetical protein